MTRWLLAPLMAFLFLGFALADEMKSARLEALWNDLASTDEVTAGRALIALAGMPKESVAFVKERLVPVKIDAARIKKLITQLDDDEFDKREAAFRQLRYFDRFAKTQLESALKVEKSLEVKKRLSVLLEPIIALEKVAEKPAAPVFRSVGITTRNGKTTILLDGKPFDPTPIIKNAPTPNPFWVRAARATALLETIDTPEAKATLEALAEGIEQARPTIEAKAALLRLKKK